MAIFYLMLAIVSGFCMAFQSPTNATLSRHIGIPSIPVVSDGDFVGEGELIAMAADGLSLPQHASVSGTVTLGNGKIIINRVR